VVLDVPYLAQSVDLCGGAAAAMVLRFWGAKDVNPGDFASLVREDERGIRTRDLVSALESRGAQARAIRAEAEDVRREIANGRPVIALIDGGGGRLHFVVIVSFASGRVLFHDPAVGPFRLLSEEAFRKAWQASGGVGIVVLPGEDVSKPRPSAVEAAPSPPEGACDPMIDGAIPLARGPDPELAVGPLMAASELCPEDGRALGALAGVRFRQERFGEAADFARRATLRNAADADAWRLLGASLYLADEPDEALVAWSRIDEPRLDRVRVRGLSRTHEDLATAVLGLQPRETLTPEALARAGRRLQELPSASGARLIYEPRPEGRADVVASVGEGGLLEPAPVLGLRLLAEFIGKREARLRFNSPTGRGEVLEVGGRFASRRPAAWASLETPRLMGLPGVVTLSGLWDRQSYAEPSQGTRVETRRRAAMVWSHWLTSAMRTESGLGIDRFEGRGTYASLSGGAEHRFWRDRAALVADSSGFLGLRGADGFAEFGASVALRNTVRPRRWTLSARFDARRATEAAPRALWPGAGTGASRAFLLRATPLVTDGIVAGDVFGRGLLHATAEAEVSVAERAMIRLGLALFTDWAKAWDTAIAPGPGPGAFSLGAGLRIHAPGSLAFRIDVAGRPGALGLRASAGVAPPWPRR
jgi:predicted double-glycine peptidase